MQSKDVFAMILILNGPGLSTIEGIMLTGILYWLILPMNDIFIAIPNIFVYQSVKYNAKYY